MSDVVRLFPDAKHEEVNQLYVQLFAVINQPQFENMSIAELVGTLDFIRLNLMLGRTE